MLRSSTMIFLPSSGEVCGADERCGGMEGTPGELRSLEDARTPSTRSVGAIQTEPNLPRSTRWNKKTSTQHPQHGLLISFKQLSMEKNMNLTKIAKSVSENEERTPAPPFPLLPLPSLLSLGGSEIPKGSFPSPPAPVALQEMARENKSPRVILLIGLL